jgi:outer membrane protein TolC
MRTIVLTLITLCALTASAQDTLTVDRAVTLAMEKNPLVRAADHERTAADWGKWSAVANFLPKVDVASSVTRIDPESERQANAAIDFLRSAAGPLGIPPSAMANIKPFAYRDTYGTQLTVVQPVFNGGLEIVGLVAANAAQDRAASSYRDTEQDVIARVRIAYLTVLKAEELVALTRENAERTLRNLELTRRRAEVGQRTKTDVLRWEVEHGSAEGDMIGAENGLALARLQLNDLLGVDLDRHFVLERVPLADTAATRPSADVPDLLDRHPSMEVMQANLRLADAGVSRAWTSFAPRINIGFQYGWEKNNTLRLDGIRPWGLALTVSYPLFNGFGDFTALQQARAEYRRTESQVFTFRRGLQLQATNAELALRSARKRLEIARTAREQALDVLNAVTRRYETGGAANVDLLDVQTAYTAAQTNFITAAYDVTIAGVQWARASGTIAR